MAAMNSVDEAAAWAHRNMHAKNTLTAEDAKMVEERFQARLLQVDQEVTANASPPAPAAADRLHASPPDGPPHEVRTQRHASVAVTPAIQKPAAIGGEANSD